MTARTDVANAQVTRTHVVRKGDTLWDLAREYTSDPYRWKQLYELNTGTVRDPHWIYPGERLRLPGADVAAADATAAPAALASSALRAGEQPDQPTVELAGRPMPSSLDGPTVFRRASNDRSLGGGAALTRAVRSAQTQRVPAPSIRAGEFYAAPYVEQAGGPPNAGRLVGSGDVPGIPLTESARPLQSNERVFIVVPPGMSSEAGARYVAVRPGPMLEGVGQVMVPTGIVVVQRAQPGQAVEARIVARFEPMEIGDQLVSMEALPRNLPRPVPLSGGGQTSVLWIEGTPELPSLQSYAVLEGGSASGMRPGDQVTFYRERRKTDDGVVLPESDIGVAQIVRVTPQASTAIVIDQSYGAIREGTAARVTAKIP